MDNANHFSSYTLLTGATGLVGQYLMHDLMKAGHRLAVVVRPTRAQSPAQRIERILRRFESECGSAVPRPIVLSGDVTEPGLGLSRADRAWVRQHCRHLIHNAAILQFHGREPDQEPWRTNLSGTRHILELCDDVDIEHLHYVSTAYVSGKRDGIIYEQDLDCNQDFRNDYERSKFAAEKLVRDSGRFATTTIYRPVVIAGDSQSGFTSSYHGIYVYLRLFALFVPAQQRDERGRILTRVQIPLDGDEPRNLVTVDWVSRVICDLFQNPQAHGHTFHLASDRSINAQALIDACVDYFGSVGVEFRGIGSVCTNKDLEFAERMFESVVMYQAYETSDPEFDTTNLQRFAEHIQCPRVDAAMIQRFIDFGIRDNWGKRKAEPIPVPDFDGACVSAIRMAADAIDGENGELRFGLRINGAGGGDWTFARNGSRRFCSQRGLGPQLGHVFEFNSDQLRGIAADVEFWKTELYRRFGRVQPASHRL